MSHEMADTGRVDPRKILNETVSPAFMTAIDNCSELIGFHGE